MVRWVAGEVDPHAADRYKSDQGEDAGKLFCPAELKLEMKLEAFTKLEQQRFR